MQDRGWKPLIICPNAVEARRIRSLLLEAGIDASRLLSEYPPAGSIPVLVAQHGTNICFLDVASHAEQALALLAEAAAAMPVVALNPKKDADLILQCLRLGASEFLSEPAADQVHEVLARLTRMNGPSETNHASLAFAVLPGKPGSGASTIAAYLAVEMKRCGATRVLLVDADGLTCNIAFLMKLKPAFHLADAVRDWSRMDADLWSRVVSHCHGIDVLPAPEDPTVRLEMDASAASGLVAFWRKHYDAIVIDIPAIGAAGTEFARLADSLLLVTTSDLSAVHASQRALEWLLKNGFDKTHIKPILNRYSPALGLKREEVESALKFAPFALLRHDWDTVQTALLDGQPVPASSHFGLGVRTLAERLLGREPTLKKRSAFFGLLNAKAEAKA